MHSSLGCRTANWKRQSLRFAICLAAFVCARIAIAEDAPAQTNLWDGNVSAGLTLTEGNSRTLLGVLGILGERKSKEFELRLGGDASYGENEGVTSAQNAHGFAQYNYLFTERLYGALRGDAYYDRVANVNYRFILGPAIGYYFIKSERTRFNGEFGPSFIYERTKEEISSAPDKRREDTHGYVALRFTERFEHQLSKTAKVWEQVDYFPQVDDYLGNFLLNAEVGAEAVMTTRLALRAVLTNKYDNRPPRGRNHHDLSLVTSLVYKF